MVHRKFLAGVLTAVTVLALSSLTIAQSSSTRHHLTIDDLIEIKHPSNPVWSPDGRRIAFIWERAGIRNLYVVNVDGSSKPVVLTSFTTDGVSHAFWSRSGDVLYFPHEGTLWQVSLTGGEAQAAWTTGAREAQFALSPDGTRVAFVRSSKDEAGSRSRDLVVRVLANANEVLLLTESTGSRVAAVLLCHGNRGW